VSDVLRGLEKGRGKPFERVAILGIGSELHGDDAVGVLVARALKENTRDRKPPEDSRPSAFTARELLVIEAGMAPEAFTGPLRRFAPDLVLMVDAAQLGEPPGTVRWFDWPEAEGLSASTHTLPPSVLAQYLVRELRCTVVLVGIQPTTLGFDEGMTRAGRRAVQQVTKELLAFLKT
jgi:hydrogenase 3 maturation protease